MTFIVGSNKYNLDVLLVSNHNINLTQINLNLGANKKTLPKGIFTWFTERGYSDGWKMIIIYVKAIGNCSGGSLHKMGPPAAMLL